MNRLIISRTDGLGDVVLTLPLAGYLKERWPEMELTFLCAAYAKDVVACSNAVDRVLTKEEVLEDPALLSGLNAEAIIFVYPDKDLALLAKSAGIPIRVGTAHRLWHWRWLNKLVWFSRKNSPLHEAQLNFKLIMPLGIDLTPSLTQLASWFRFTQLPAAHHSSDTILFPRKRNVVFHPLSKGSARDWPLTHWDQLAKQLHFSQYQIFITGTKEEGKRLHSLCPSLFLHSNVMDLTGNYKLGELVAFLAKVDALVAASTGPLHIAAALGKPVIGLYPPMKPVHPGRWAPLGDNAKVLVLDKICSDCRNGELCQCMQALAPTQVAQTLDALLSENTKRGV